MSLREALDRWESAEIVDCQEIVDAARDLIERLEELHRPNGWGDSCLCGDSWPCRSVRAL